jgi:hypothetical protein
VLSTASADESVVQADRSHPAGPNQQRVGRIGGTLIAVAATFDHNSQRMGASKVDRSYDVARGLGGNRKGAGL